MQSLKHRSGWPRPLQGTAIQYHTYALSAVILIQRNPYPAFIVPKVGAKSHHAQSAESVKQTVKYVLIHTVLPKIAV